MKNLWEPASFQLCLHSTEPVFCQASDPLCLYSTLSLFRYVSNAWLHTHSHVLNYFEYDGLLFDLNLSGECPAVDFETKMYAESLDVLEHHIKPLRRVPGVVLEQTYLNKMADGLKPLEHLASCSSQSMEFFAFCPTAHIFSVFSFIALHVLEGSLLALIIFLSFACSKTWPPSLLCWSL